METPNFAGQALEAWKTQLDTALKVVEALTEGAIKMHDTQLEAATDAHANAEATRQSLAKAADPAELNRIASQWYQHNGEHAVAYWRALFEAALETNAAMLKCLGAAQPLLALPGGQPFEVDASKNALLGMVDNAYKQWLQTTQRLYTAPTE